MSQRGIRTETGAQVSFVPARHPRTPPGSRAGLAGHAPCGHGGSCAAARPVPRAGAPRTCTHADSRTWRRIQRGVCARRVRKGTSGSVLAAACEQSQVLLIDPRCCRLVHTVPYAHEDCVNNIRFLDGRLFASCSDDTTVALWDQRRLTCPVSRLRGHTSWVKNIEFEPLGGLLVTSGFDGNVLVWETNSCTEEGCPHRTFFHTNSLMRMRLTPDCSSMLISTSPGYLLVLYNLDLSQADIHGDPNSGSVPKRRGPKGSHGRSHTVSAQRRNKEVWKRNALEVYTLTVPDGEEQSFCITSLQMHPLGRHTLTRCNSISGDEEWTCIYELPEIGQAPIHSHHGSLQPTHASAEANVGRGFIKEISFSPDGRLVCSPSGFGLRIMTFEPSDSREVLKHKNSVSVLGKGTLTGKENASEHPLPHWRPLGEVRSVYGHNDVVLTAKFSPTHCQLASGCLSGSIAIYQPRF
uniref:DDB1- and CUL4-associated factor 10 isoform X2 n=1 Tax=Myxine glutinosa TaxID=7769 RepID=UPI00358EAECE